MGLVEPFRFCIECISTRTSRTAFTNALSNFLGYQSRLGGEKPDVKQSDHDLEALKNTILDDTQDLRSRALGDYRRIMSQILIPCGIVGLLLEVFWHSNYIPESVFQYFTPSDFSELHAKILAGSTDENVRRLFVEERDAAVALYKKGTALLVALFWLPVGVALGNFVQFVFRNSQATFDNLLRFDQYNWSARDSYSVLIITGYILLVILLFQVVQLGVFGVLLNDFSRTEPGIAIVVGLTTALGFTAVRDLMQALRISRREQ
jgi:hypothetical protein